jgi:regulator of sigma E protease
MSTLLPFIAVLGALIFVHELGHFLVAKFFQIKVEVFSLGFGPRLLGFRWGDTDYRISAVPLGGYVKMKGEYLDEELEHTGDEFLAKSKWQRFLVLFAGPAMNIVMAILIPAIMAMFFFKVPLYKTQAAVIGSVAQASAAAQAGLQPGDKILKFGNKDNPSWHEVEINSEISPNIPIPMVVERQGQRLETTLTPKVYLVDREKVGLSGLLPPFKNSNIVVAQVSPNSPASQAGLQVGDKLLQLNTQPVPNIYWLQYSLQNLQGSEASLMVERQGKPQELKVKPRLEQDGKVRIGFGWNPDLIPSEDVIIARKSLPEALSLSLRKNYEIMVLTKDAIGQIFTGQRKAGEALSGPISIAAISGKVYQAGGITSLLDLMAVLSLNLGVINLFPIPVLDGGHIFILMIEGLLGLVGYKLSLSIKEKMLQTGFVMLVLLMGFVIINDISKFFIQPRLNPAAVSAPANNNGSGNNTGTNK